jgi:hypothetical protein
MYPNPFPLALRLRVVQAKKKKMLDDPFAPWGLGPSHPRAMRYSMASLDLDDVEPIPDAAWHSQDLDRSGDGHTGKSYRTVYSHARSVLKSRCASSSLSLSVSGVTVARTHRGVISR